MPRSRLLRASKNRFGSTEEVGVFEMSDGGLAEVADPGPGVPRRHDGPSPGSVVAPTLEGTRPLLVEVQALVAPAGLRHAAANDERCRWEPPRAARRRPRETSRDRPGEPRRLREPRRRPDRRGAGARPAACARAGIVAARPAGRSGHRRDRRGRAPRRAPSRRGPRASSARCARLGFTGRSSPAPRDRARCRRSTCP